MTDAGKAQNKTFLQFLNYLYSRVNMTHLSNTEPWAEPDSRRVRWLWSRRSKNENQCFQYIQISRLRGGCLNMPERGCVKHMEHATTAHNGNRALLPRIKSHIHTQTNVHCWSVHFTAASGYVTAGTCCGVYVEVYIIMSEQSTGRPVTCNHRWPELLIFQLLEMHFRMTTLI